jgi:cell wall-associated NlpC family hydrolase
VRPRAGRAAALLAAAVAGAGLPASAGVSGALAAAGDAAAREPTGTCAVLGQGATGHAVQVIQREVGTTADGDFGPHTAAAVRGWERRHHLSATGTVDAAMWRALPFTVSLQACRDGVHGAERGCPVLAQGATGPAVAALQSRIGTSVDGDFGPLTRAAVAAAQRHHHLTATGRAGQRLFYALRLTGTPTCWVPARGGGSGGSGGSARSAEVRRIEEEVRAWAARLHGAAATDNHMAQEAVRFGLSQRGVPYQWGGTGPHGYDCSGLVQTSYRHAGISLARTAAQQYATGGRRYPLDQARQGDLLFFASNLTAPATIYHVVIYIGYGKVLAAPHSGTVVQTQRLWTEGLLPYVVRPDSMVRLPIREGDRGMSVKQLQWALNRDGAGLTVDGDDGPLTTGAVQAQQRRHHLRADGVVDRSTWQAIAHY